MGGHRPRIEYDLGEANIKSITAYRQNIDRKSLDIDAIPVPIYYLNPFQTKIKQFTQEIQLNGNAISDRLHYSLGAFYIRSKGFDRNRSFSNPLVVATTPTFVDALVDVRSPSVFGQATFDITPTFHFTGGLRYTREKRILSEASFGGRRSRYACCRRPPASTGPIASAFIPIRRAMSLTRRA